jgi:undecaprenyl phosphate-alpha-L-ara4N flippase subunit ArnE|tara:strand:- start:4237 stop:4605 length:369 start_codon:yes stop_codon:yes gene_type:complete
MPTGLSILQVAQLVGFAFLLACGQILFKRVAIDIAGDQLTSIFGQILHNPMAWLAMCLYGVATGLWIIILREVPLSVAYLFSALGFVIVPAAAHFIYGEPISAKYLIGAAGVIASLYLIANS